jgi:hypothetical protein
MREILSTEQPCIFCGMALQVVTIHRNDDTGEERIERTDLPHSDEECLRMVRLYQETWPALGGQR